MSWTDAAGLLGVVLILIAYALATTGRLDPKKPISLLANFVGASLILVSLTRAFNLSAAVIEAAWALISLVSLARIGWGRVRN